MRFLPLAIVVCVLGCSSEETPAKTSTAFQCTSRGFVCLDNFPLKCIGQYEDVTDPALKNVCGKSVGDGVTDVPCCQKVADQPDTGTVDTGVTDAGSETATDATTDGTTDALADAAETTADAPDGG